MIDRIRKESPTLRHALILDSGREGFASLAEMIDRPARLPESTLTEIKIDPTDPAIFSALRRDDGNSQINSPHP